MRTALLLIACAITLAATALADVGADVQSELIFIQSSSLFRNVAVVNGRIGGGLQRWKLSSSDL